MKSLHVLIIAGIMITGIIITFHEIFPNTIKTTKVGCLDPELKDLQYNPNLKVKQQVDSIAFADPEIEKIINASTYCEIMSVSTVYTANGAYQGLNINLNNTKNLVALVSLQNNSVVSYELLNLTRNYPAP